MGAWEIVAAFAVTLVGVIVVFLVITTYNGIVGLTQRIDKAWANIEVALKQRHDKLPNLVHAVRDLMGYERGVLEPVITHRLRRLAQGQHLGVGCGVVLRDRRIGASSGHPPLDHHERPNGHFARGSCLPRQLQRLLHEQIVHGFRRIE